jgi:hypothetical protein
MSGSIDSVKSSLRLREVMAAVGLDRPRTTAEFGRLMDLSQPTVASWLKDRTRPDEDVLTNGFSIMAKKHPWLSDPRALAVYVRSGGPRPGFLTERLIYMGVPTGPQPPSTPPGGTAITDAIRNATATVLASWAPATIRLANMARQSSDPTEVESIRDEILELLVADHRRGRSSVGRAAAFYPDEQAIEFVIAGTEEPGTASSPFARPSTPLTVPVLHQRSKIAA